MTHKITWKKVNQPVNHVTSKMLGLSVDSSTVMGYHQKKNVTKKQRRRDTTNTRDRGRDRQQHKSKVATAHNGAKVFLNSHLNFMEKNPLFHEKIKFFTKNQAFH